MIRNPWDIFFFSFIPAIFPDSNINFDFLKSLVCKRWGTPGWLSQLTFRLLISAPGIMILGS